MKKSNKFFTQVIKYKLKIKYYTVGREGIYSVLGVLGGEKEEDVCGRHRMKIANICDQEMPSFKRKLLEFIDQSKRSNRKLFCIL